MQYVNEWSHLGHIISANDDDAHDIMSQRCSIIGQINSILRNFRHVDCCTKILLVEAYCTSFYGCELWDMSNYCIENICTTWRCGIRQVWRLPSTTHSSLLLGLCQTIPILDLFYKLMLKFVYRCLNKMSVIDCKFPCTTHYLVQSYELHNRPQCAALWSTLSHQHIQYTI
jgi:hypothetical protein